MGPEGLILLSGKPADTTLPVVPLKSMHWLQIYIVIRGIWVQTKGKHCKMLYKTLFPQSLSEKKSRAGQGPVMLGQSTRLPPSSAWLGQCSVLPGALTSVEKKLFPSLFLLSCSASRHPPSRAVSWRRLSMSGAAEGRGAAGQQGRGLRRQQLTPVLCLSPGARGLGELRARSK